MKKTRPSRLAAATLLALSAAIPGAALAYGEQDAINDCEGRLRSEYHLSDLRDAKAERLNDTVHHYQVQGQTKIDGNRYPWTCEVKNRHVVAAEYSGPKQKGLGTAEKLAIGAGAAIAAGLAANELSKPKATGTPATTTGSTPAPGGASYPNRCEVYASGSKTPKTQACSYSQHQGAAYIQLADGTEYALDPVGNTPGNYVLAGTKDKVVRKSGLGAKGMIYQFPRQTIKVYY